MKFNPSHSDLLFSASCYVRRLPHHRIRIIASSHHGHVFEQFYIRVGVYC